MSFPCSSGQEGQCRDEHAGPCRASSTKTGGPDDPRHAGSVPAIAVADPEPRAAARRQQDSRRRGVRPQVSTCRYCDCVASLRSTRASRSSLSPNAALAACSLPQSRCCDFVAGTAFMAGCNMNVHRLSACTLTIFWPAIGSAISSSSKRVMRAKPPKAFLASSADIRPARAAEQQFTAHW